MESVDTRVMKREIAIWIPSDKQGLFIRSLISEKDVDDEGTSVVQYCECRFLWFNRE
jgi:hypothetical protein